MSVLPPACRMAYGKVVGAVETVDDLTAHQALAHDPAAEGLLLALLGLVLRAENECMTDEPHSHGEVLAAVELVDWLCRPAVR